MQALTQIEQNSKHTPGPWKATTNAYGCHFVQRWEAGAEHGLICGGNSHDTLTEANARLIAVAPDMLDFIRQIAKRDPVFAKGHDKQVIADARALIAKAEGR